MMRSDKPPSKIDKPLNRFLSAVSSLVLVLSLKIPVAEAQQPKIPRLGFLIASSAPVQKPRLEAFRQGLRALGYVEGKNISIDYRYADGKPERLPALAAELLQLNVDVIIAAGGSPPTGPPPELPR